MPAAIGAGGDPVAAARGFLASLKGGGPLVVAVSGGGDSVALLAACHLVLSSGSAPPRRLIAATVDHGLRPGSAEEARQVAAMCAGLGVEHHILCWNGEKPAAGLQAAARLARYRLLAGLAARAEAVGVATAHTRDDQAETVAMRAGRHTLAMRAARHDAGTGTRGLAGMAPATLFERACWILRPFLGVGRAELRSWLLARGIGWTEDPSNEDERFERVRVRRGGAAVPPADLAGRQQSRRRAAESVAAFVRACGRCHGGFVVSLDLPGADPAEAALPKAAALFMAIAGGRPHPPGRETGERLASFLEAETAARSGAARFTAARAIAELRGGRLWLYRERRNLPDMVLSPGQQALYDGRYRVRVTGGEAVRLAPAGAAAVTVAGNDPALSGIPRAVARRALSCEPVVIRQGREAFAWQAETQGVEIARHFAPFDVFLPLFDYMLANECAVLFGQEPYPPPPLAGMAA